MNNDAEYLAWLESSQQEEVAYFEFWKLYRKSPYWSKNK
jgi:hypothetical protein